MALVDPSCFLGLPPEERRQQLYEALYTWAGNEELTDPACFLGLTPEEQGMAMLDGVISGSAGLPAPENLIVTLHEDGTFSYSHDPVDGAAGYLIQTDDGPQVDVGNVTSGSNLTFP